MTELRDPPGRFFTTPCRPRFYRYQVAKRGLRIAANRYSNQASSALIGVAVVIGRYAYCVKWANATWRP